MRMQNNNDTTIEELQQQIQYITDVVREVKAVSGYTVDMKDMMTTLIHRQNALVRKVNRLLWLTITALIMAAVFTAITVVGLFH